MMQFGNRMMTGFGGRFFGIGEMLICAAVLVLVVLGVIALVRYIRFTGRGHKIEMPTANTALLILNERYAKGEISDEEYKAKKAEILK